MLDLGIDPSIRHTGLCLLGATKSPIQFFQIDTDLATHPSLYESVKTVRPVFVDFIRKLKGRDVRISLERQLSVGGQSSSLQFYAQMLLLEIIYDELNPSVIYMPLPNQLHSYMRKVHRLDPSSKSAIVAGFREQTGWPTRVSSHKVDAYYLASLGKDTAEGRWQYNLPSKELELIPGRIDNGQRT